MVSVLTRPPVRPGHRPTDEVMDQVADFSKLLIQSRDVDPDYALLSAVYTHILQVPKQSETALWFTALYLAYNSTPSALAAFRLQPEPGYMPQEAVKYPCAVERRGLRGGKVIDHIASYVTHTWIGGQLPWMTQRWVTADQWEALGKAWGERMTPQEYNYMQFWETGQTVWQNGRRAVHKWLDILKNVHGLPVAAPDLRMQYCSGPKAGLIALYGLNENASLKVLDAAGADMRVQLAQRGVHSYIPDIGMAQDGLDWETLETVLCDWNNLTLGRYYVGHDIDDIQKSLRKADYLSKADQEALWEARAIAFPDAYLGERHGWEGTDLDRNKIFRKTGQIVGRP
jgi:hypothetical protein